MTCRSIHEKLTGLLYVCNLYIDSSEFSFDYFTDISKHYSQKATIEHELPTATQKLITTNDCILSSVVALTNGAGKVIFPGLY